jgi:hypothetical protein
MASSRGFVVVVVLALLTTPAVAARSKHHTRHETSSDPRWHVRPGSAHMRAVLDEAIRYSPTISDLVERIDASNVIVHVECARLHGLTLQGRTLFVVAKRDVRYVRVQVDCLLMTRELTAIIGHELQHVAEIAAAPDVVDEPSFGRLLQRIGFSVCCSTAEQYETNAALDSGARVGNEILVHRVVSIAPSH